MMLMYIHVLEVLDFHVPRRRSNLKKEGEGGRGREAAPKTRCSISQGNRRPLAGKSKKKSACPNKDLKNAVGLTSDFLKVVTHQVFT